ncbi:hypothetical protein DYH09_18090 [bacterium CPR1]|jgi:hypothetical protein|nr:hypothetical protein [bacterium CPR1]
MTIATAPQVGGFSGLLRGSSSFSTSSASVDTYGPSNPTSLEGLYTRPTFTQGKREAMSMAGVGVMMTGIMVGAALGSPWGPPVMIGSMFAGLALMAAARESH